MATAPEPGVGRKKAERKQRVDSAQSIVTIRYADETFSLAWLNVPIGEQIAVRKATGLPLAAFTTPLSDAETGPGVVGEDSLLILWWLARRASGQTQLNFETACNQWDRAELGAVEISTPDEGDDPES